LLLLFACGAVGCPLPRARAHLRVFCVQSSLASRLEEATRLKDEGNARFKAEDYRGAIVSYKRVYLYTKGLDTAVEGDAMHQYGAALHKELPSPEVVAAARSVSGAVSGNLAAAYLHLGDWERVIVYAKKVGYVAAGCLWWVGAEGGGDEPDSHRLPFLVALPAGMPSGPA
jgi:hypothetical protein